MFAVENYSRLFSGFKYVTFRVSGLCATDLCK